MSDMVTPNVLEKTKQQHFATNLRQLANFYRDNPEFPVPTWQDFSVWPESVLEIKAHAITMRPAKRSETKEYLKFIKTFGNLKLMSILCKSSHCKRVEVGERTVLAVEAIPEHVEKVYEWKCE